MKRMRPFSLLPVVFLFMLTGCGDIFYLSKLGWHQSYIAFHSVPIEEVLKEPQLSQGVKEKILFIQKVKRFGEERLGLTHTDNYSTFFETPGPVLRVVTAAEKDRLHAYVWTFPVVGKVTYKSYFTEEGARKEREKLDKEGYDTFVQPVEAYSTLGWFRDPIFSPMLQWNEVSLANVILHEMAHATIYFKGRTDFNEQLATFIGSQGAVDFLRETYGSGSKEALKASQVREDDIRLSGFVDLACQRLTQFYDQRGSKEEKLKGREALFRSLKEEFLDIRGQFKTAIYRELERTDFNNAVFLAYRRYIHQLQQFQALYERCGGDLRTLVQLFTGIQKAGKDPVSALREAPRPSEIEGGPIAPSFRQ